MGIFNTRPGWERILGRMVAVLAGVLSLAVTAKADFADYLKKPEPVYKWEKRGEEVIDGVTVTDLHLVSQTWQGEVWEHRLQIFRPEKPKYSHFCTLYNTGGNGGKSETQMGVMSAKNSGAAFGILFGIPKQPLYGGKTEDALVVYTWLQFLKTGDESWPLHFPMAKAVIKAMDAIQEFTRPDGKTQINDFIVCGASKRGWTTWLVGASQDRRVKAIAPMVIDTLNLKAQIPHQLEAYGKPSDQVGDYTSAGLIQLLQTDKGKRLLELEDPYSYRDLLTQPKLIILGTNDQYWSQDSLNLYWDGLKGSKWVLYVPNSGHGLEDRVRLFNTLTAYTAGIAGKMRWPRMKWVHKTDESGNELLVMSDIKPKSGRLFRVFAPTKDFRNQKWTFEPMSETKAGFTGRLAMPETGFAATYGELTYEIGGHTFTLSTQINIIGKGTGNR